MEWGGLDLFVICVEGAQTDKTLLPPPLVLPESSVLPHLRKTRNRRCLRFSPPAAETRPVCCTVSARWREICLVAVCDVCVDGDARAHQIVSLSSGVKSREQRWVHLWPVCDNNSMDGRRKVENRSTGVVAVMETSSSLLKEHRVSRQKVKLTKNTRQNNVHQHTVVPSRSRSRQVVCNFVELQLIFINFSDCH